MDTLHTDVTIIGAGPAGLCLARALSGTGLRVVLLERQGEAALRSPAFDGREIALTHRSRAFMQRLDLWRRLPEGEVHALRDAHVYNGDSPRAMRIGHEQSGREALGFLVPNHEIRRVAFEAAMEVNGVTLLAGVKVIGVERSDSKAEVALDDGRRIVSRLLVAADSRFSETRRAAGIATRMFDFGRSMLVCRVTQEVPHADTAWEWFDHAQTLALLPLGNATPRGHRASVVLTLPAPQMREVQALDDEAFARDIARRFHGRLGRIDDVGERHVYPLVGTYADRFVATRLALIGDAAVGMHPVTAHGFNLGLLGVERLAGELREAAEAGTDIGDPARLARFERGHRRATLPLYLATRGIVGLFTDDRWPARRLRAGLLWASDRLAPFKKALAAMLADEGAGRANAADRIA
ncbi:5-demethoxyubiquinol-8 5-hydroxylase UbiM [Lysobacter sp. LF1]|uniref:5-demethoxyubiquinol-8 5-hydroxylase UbiM n=1 Tax=Lysobacter stagni TaxID=3045172 RepID=A0ABT6XD53_9GAMM|nr:5-demethoxyubiquinol-8 5-hydroxylase UbiM [Lysobacter sp. LF1]MDI9238080.1 5-demethoxyubiquinol-8 5-hydroxylase UbiM [Lysobacter sp. LF1]